MAATETRMTRVASSIKPEWRGPGCDDRCALRMVIVPGLLGRQSMAVHDPEAHEQFGSVQAGGRGAQLLLESGPVRFARRELRLWVGEREVVLTPTEWLLWLAILDGNGAPVTAATLSTMLWGDVVGRGEPHALRVNMARLRARLGEAAGLIETVAGVGYRFVFLPPGTPAPAQRVVRATLIAAGRWSRYVGQRCARCGTTTRPHRGHGYCDACYGRLRHAGHL